MNKHENITNPLEPVVEDEQLSKALAVAYPASAASPQLRRRVENLVARNAEKQRMLQTRRGVLRRGFALAGAVAMLFIAIKAWPVLSLELFLRRVEAATSNVKSWHVTSWVVTDNGQRIKEREAWFQDSRWREEQWPVENRNLWREIRIVTDGKSWNYSPKRNTVTVRPAGRYDGWAYNYGSSRLTGTTLINDLKRMNQKGETKVTVTDNVTEGRPTRLVQAQTKTDHETTDISLLVDAASDLPIQAEVNAVTSRGKGMKLFMEFSFNETLDAKLFEPDFPKSVQVIDIDKGKEEWRQRLSKGIAQRQVGNRTIVIRDLQVNSRGHIFVLYTAGRKFERDLAKFEAENRYDGKDWRVELTDQFGTKYTKVTGLTTGRSFRPVSEYIKVVRPVEPNGYLFNGERLEGEWWVPSKPQQSWKPREFTLTFRVWSINQHGLRGKRDKTNIRSWSFQGEEEDIPFNLHVDGATKQLLPDYMPYMAEAPTEPDVLKADEDYTG